MKEPLLLPEDDTRDNVYYYDEEGGGEEDQVGLWLWAPGTRLLLLSTPRPPGLSCASAPHGPFLSCSCSQDCWSFSGLIPLDVPPHTWAGRELPRVPGIFLIYFGHSTYTFPSGSSKNNLEF